MQNVTAKTHKIIYNFVKALGKSKRRNITAAVTALIKQDKLWLFMLELCIISNSSGSSAISREKQIKGSNKNDGLVNTINPEC